MCQYTKVNVSENDIQKLNYEQVLKNKSNKIGITLIVTHVLMSIISVLLMLYIGVTGFYNIFNANNGFYGYDPIAYYLVTGVVVIISIAIPFLILLRNSSIDYNKILPFDKIESNDFIAFILFGLSVCMISNIVTMSYSSIFEKIGYPMQSGETYYSSDPIVIILMIICTALLPALFEEFAFRGVILGLLRKYGDFFAILISSICFAFMHSTILQIPFALSIGLVLGFITVKSNSLLPAICIHFINNLISVLETIFANTLGDSAAGSITMFIMFFCIFIGIYAIKYLHNNKSNFFTIDNNVAIKVSSKRRFEIFFKSPAVIITIIMFVISVIVMAVNGGVL